MAMDPRTPQQVAERGGDESASPVESLPSTPPRANNGDQVSRTTQPVGGGSPPAASGSPDTEPPRRASPSRTPSTARRWIFLGALTAIAAAAIFIIHYFSYVSTHPSTDDAQVDGATIAVNSQITARVASLYVQGDQAVRKGQLLATLDPVNAQVAANQAAAAEAQAVAAGAQVETARGDLAAARATDILDQRNYQREAELFTEGAVSAQDRDTARSAAAVAAPNIVPRKISWRRPRISSGPHSGRPRRSS